MPALAESLAKAALRNEILFYHTWVLPLREVESEESSARGGHESISWFPAIIRSVPDANGTPLETFGAF